MTYRNSQNLLVIGGLLLIALFVFYPFLKRGEYVESLGQPQTQNVSAATTINVWVHRKTGLYYCPESKFYGKVRPGVYMTQEKALEAGYRPAAWEPCR